MGARAALAVVGGAVAFGAAGFFAQYGAVSGHIWLFAVGGLVFLAIYYLRRRVMILLAGIAWLLEGGWELFLRLSLGERHHEYNIRLDLLAIVPMVIAISTAAGAAIFWPEVPRPGNAENLSDS